MPVGAARTALGGRGRRLTGANGHSYCGCSSNAIDHLMRNSLLGTLWSYAFDSIGIAIATAIVVPGGVGVR